jgi:uncharacterized membrane protein
VLLSAFGTFWVGEGIGVAWPGDDLAIPCMMAAYLALALYLVPLCRRRARRVAGAQALAQKESCIAAKEDQR